MHYRVCSTLLLDSFKLSGYGLKTLPTKTLDAIIFIKKVCGVEEVLIKFILLLLVKRNFLTLRTATTECVFHLQLVSVQRSTRPPLVCDQ